VLAPVGIIVKLLPEQINPLLTEITGLGFTETVDTPAILLTHPAVLVPVTEYEVVVVGLMIAEPPE
jgi:hypothetical protein